MRKTGIIMILFCVLSGLSGFAQDPSFTQFYFNKLYFNPAFAGLSNGLELSLTHREQWPNLPGKFSTSKFSADLDISGIRGLGGVGLNVIQDIEGEGSLKTLSVGIPISIRPMNLWAAGYGNKPHYFNFQAGFLLSMTYKSVNWDKFVYSDQLDAVNGVVRPSSFNSGSDAGKILPDFGFGMVFDYQNAPFGKTYRNNWNVRAGFAIHHITEPDYSFLGKEMHLPKKYVAHINFNFPIKKDEDFIVAPAFIYEKQASMQTFQCGVNALWRVLFVGVWYRSFNNSDAMAVVLGMKLGRKSRFYGSYSYDATLSRLSPATLGSHEINISYQLDQSQLKGKKRDKKKGRRRIPCPMF
ncbi:MAG: PorP/SprF family type IX secretion system membrane protein [Bacteroidota bacterium]